MTDQLLLDSAQSMDDLAGIALSDLKEFAKTGGEIIQICGPMSTGGLGNLQKNMDRFKNAILKASEKGLCVFNQLPYQDALVRITGYYEGAPYNMDILEVLYRRLFESGYIKRALFLPGWEGSIGATWEHELLINLGIKIEMYPIEWLDKEE